MALTVSVDEIVHSSRNRLLSVRPHWRRIRLGEIASVLNGFAFKSAQFTKGEGKPLIRIRDVGSDSTDTNYVGEFDERYTVEPGDLLVGMDGDFSCARWRGPRSLLNQRVCKITLESDQYHPRFLDFALPGYLKAINEATSSVTVKHLSSRTIEDIPLPFPPLHEQEEIVAELEKQFSRLDEAVANLKRVRDNLERYLAATLGEAFSGKWAGTEANWPPVPLREVADVQLGQQRAPVHAADTNPTPYVRAANVTWRGLDLSDVKSMGFPNPARYRLAYGDILLAEASGSANEVGKPAVWRGEIPGACYQKTLIRVRCRADVLNYEFAYYFFLHTALSGQFAKLAPGVGILHLTAERMLAWPTVAPPLTVQASIVAEIDRRLSILREVGAEVDANLKRAQALRQAVLAHAFLGMPLDGEQPTSPIPKAHAISDGGPQ